ncbi:hypothetical protein SAMN04488109_1152 [Chryseolinea serpens]|uniref:Uncharacterized protein n=1 Tax=Chryseolinea serpens TaxID=947013 RepID=A0A1M5LDH5_9BACT|nr:hypothetical protein [Chryseolinea serpens]SHG63078.1 hypothetical protein SAMN04488109_1152 [Chryseolinea serpens]
MNRIILTTFFFISLIAASCKSQAPRQKVDGDPEIQGVSEDHELVFEQDAASIYDSIAPPRLLADSVLIYKELANRLKFANHLKGDGGTDLVECSFAINEKGEIESKFFRSSKSIDASMRTITDDLLDQMRNWEPAYYKTDPKKKMRIRLNMYFFFHEKEILFRFYGPERYYILKKSFQRPISE